MKQKISIIIGIVVLTAVFVFFRTQSDETSRPAAPMDEPGVNYSAVLTDGRRESDSLETDMPLATSPDNNLMSSESATAGNAATIARLSGGTFGPGPGEGDIDVQGPGPGESYDSAADVGQGPGAQSVDIDALGPGGGPDDFDMAGPGPGEGDIDVPSAGPGGIQTKTTGPESSDNNEQ